MRTKQDIDIAYLQELQHKIKQILEAYQANHKHFFFKFTDPYRIKPVSLYIQSLGLIDDVSIRLVEQGPMSAEALNALCFERYVGVLALLKDVAHYLPLKSLLIGELSTQVEAQWENMKGSDMPRMQQSLFLLQQQSQTHEPPVQICSIVPSR